MKIMKIKAHEVRALSLTLAYLNSVPLDDVMRAVIGTLSQHFLLSTLDHWVHMKMIFFHWPPL